MGFSMRLTQQPTTLLARRALLRAAAALIASQGWLPAWADSPTMPALTNVQTRGFSLQVPSSYYQQKSRARVSTYDDTLFVAADYVGGRSASAAVSRVSAASLLIDSGDPIALTASESTNGPTELRELGRPNKIATLLASRRDNDPTGVNVPAFELVTASRDGNELRFELEYPAAEVTSMTKASPKARRVLARSLFVPAEGSLDGVGGGAPSYLLTVWASSISTPVCEPTPCGCGEGSSLSCECPPPKCAAARDTPPDPTDEAIINSLRAVRSKSLLVY